MCTAMRNKELRDRVTGFAEAMKSLNYSEDDIVEETTKKYGVSRDYILEVLREQA